MKNLLEAIRPTTFIEPEKLAKQLGLDITVATETFQHTGSFKFRAGYNVALSVPHDELFTASSGNFGQGLARACMLLGKKCTVVMPDSSARVKIDSVASYGATVDLIDVGKISRSERIAQIAAEKGDAYFASAYDDPWVIEGNASLGDELANCGKEFDVVIAPIGGGGLTSGIIKGLRRNGKETPVYAAEPLLGNDAARSLREGHIVKNEQEPATLADGARTKASPDFIQRDQNVKEAAGRRVESMRDPQADVSAVFRRAGEVRNERLTSADTAIEMRANENAALERIRQDEGAAYGVVANTDAKARASRRLDRNIVDQGYVPARAEKNRQFDQAPGRHDQLPADEVFAAIDRVRAGVNGLAPGRGARPR